MKFLSRAILYFCFDGFDMEFDLINDEDSPNKFLTLTIYNPEKFLSELEMFFSKEFYTTSDENIVINGEFSKRVIGYEVLHKGFLGVVDYTIKHVRQILDI